MGAFDNGFRLNPAIQPVDGDVLLYDAATDGVRPGGGVPGQVGVTKANRYGTASGSVAAGTSLGTGATEVDVSLRVTAVTVPASGKLLVDMAAWLVCATSGSCYWYPRIVLESSGAEVLKPAVRAALVGTGAPQRSEWVSVPYLASGLIGGSVVRVEWQHAATVAGFAIASDSGQGQYATMQVTTL